MSKIVPRWFAVLAASSLAMVTYSAWSSFTAPETLPQESAIAESEVTESATDVTLTEYFWLDSIPEDAYTPFNAYLFTNKIGINNQFASAFKTVVEIFEFKVADGTIGFHFPHDNRAVSTKYAIKEYRNPKYPFLSAELVLASDPQAKGKTKSYYTGPDMHLKSTHQSLPESVQAALQIAER